jgi:hypothetical protein
MGTYVVRDDETGTTCSFNYADIVTEGSVPFALANGSAFCPTQPTPATPST